MGEDTKRADTYAVIVAIIFLGIGFLLAFVIDSSLATVPSQFNPPRIFALFPIVMCSIPLILCIALFRAKKKKSDSPKVRRYSDEPIVYTGDYELHAEPISQNKETVYLIPLQCPSCNSELSTEEIDWIGPLQAKCPYCGATIDATERTL